MASRTFLFLVFFASTVSMILSILQINPQFANTLQEEPVASVAANPNADPENPNVLVADNVPQLRTFGSLFNLSAYLAGAPNDSAALNFVPLITILSALG